MRKTVGEVSVELSQKQPESRDPIEIQREMTQDYLDNLRECAQTFIKDKSPLSDFYVVVQTRREKVLSNVLRNQFYGVFSCPTPNYDQALYVCRKETQDIEFVWVIPDKETCHHLRDNAALVHPEERQLLQYVLDFSDGTLYALCKQLNGERKDSPLLER